MQDIATSAMMEVKEMLTPKERGIMRLAKYPNDCYSSCKERRV
jgi:hypothetical protein